MRFTHWLAAGFAVAAIASAAPAQDDPKALFAARYAELRAAMQAKDAAAIARIVAPDYAMTDIRGETHDAASLTKLADRMQGGAPDRTTEAEVLAAAVTGPTAQVRQKVNTRMTRVGPDGAPHKMEMIVLTDDTWVQIDGAWRLRTSIQKDLTVLRDGEEFFHQAN